MKPRSQSGARLAGLVVAVVMVLVFSACGFGAGDDGEAEATSASGSAERSSGDGAEAAVAAGETQSVAVTALTVGICFDEPASVSDRSDDEIDEVAVVACDQQHDSEVYFVGVLGDGDYPGDEDLEQAVTTNCVERFGSFVGIDYEHSSLEISFFYPGESGWAADDREYVCSVFDLAGNKLQGSMADTGY